MKMLAVSVFDLLFTACGNDFDPSSRVSELRLLAVQADHPFALPGEAVQLSALAFDPEGRSLSWGWGLCIDASSTVALDCLRASSFASLTIGTDLPQHTLVVPPTDAPYVGVVVVVCPGAIVPGDTVGVPLSCQDASGLPVPLAELEIGLKRIFIHDPALNRNPVISGLYWDGALWPEGERKLDSCLHTENSACTSWTKHALEVSAPDAEENSVDSGGTREQAVVQLYATGGTFDDDVRIVDDAVTKWRARPEDAGKLIVLWFVVRDDRGGVSWITRELQVP